MHLRLVPEKVGLPDEKFIIGFHKASNEAKARWQADGRATGLIMYEERNMARSADGTQARVISPTECERLLGFEPRHKTWNPRNWIPA